MGYLKLNNYSIIDNIMIPCLFKRLFNVACPTCGMTRAFKYLLKFDFVRAFNYNILSIPLAIIFVLIGILILIDTVINTEYLNGLWQFIIRHYVFIIILLTVSMIINNVRGI